MRIALVASPFLAVPPRHYGGTELFLAHLAAGLAALGHDPVVYSIGDSTVACENRWRVRHGHWPLEETLESSLEDLEHAAWACQDAAAECDLIHLNNAPGLTFSRMLPRPFVYTLHHAHDPALSRYYLRFPGVAFAAISRSQARAEPAALHPRVIHHGLDLTQYRAGSGPRTYLAFLGRVAPVKGVHLAIEVALRAGIPLRIAGEIQPVFRDYWLTRVRPQVDGRNVEYVGEVDLAGKNELLAGALALLFPIQWDEPFGLVMIEAMACGVPVLAFPRGSAPEVVEDGVNGFLCPDLAAMSAALARLPLPWERCRATVAARFSVGRMAAAYARFYAEVAAPAEERRAS